MIRIKEFEVIGSSYACNVNCKFCTAKITLWPRVKDQYKKLFEHFAEFERRNMRFYYFTMSGNGEPSLTSLEDLKTITSAVTKYRHLFKTLRFQTSGAVFHDEEKFRLLNNTFVFEITRFSPELEKNNEAIGRDTLELKNLNRDYTKHHNFKLAKIHFNAIVRRENATDNYQSIKNDITHYIDNFPNVAEISPKVLNPNTLRSDYSNPYSRWILENALTNSDSENVIAALNEQFTPKECYNNFFDYIEWTYKGVPIMFHVKKYRYGQSTIVYYGGELIDFKLNKIDLDQLGNEARAYAAGQ